MLFEKTFRQFGLLCTLSIIAATSSIPARADLSPLVVGGGIAATGCAFYYFTSGYVGRFLLSITESYEKDYRLVRDDEKTGSEKGYKKLKKQIIRNNNASIVSALFGHQNYPLKSYHDGAQTDAALLWIFMLPNWFNEDGNKMSKRMKKACYIAGVVSEDPTLHSENRDSEAKKDRDEIKKLLKQGRR